MSKDHYKEVRFRLLMLLVILENLAVILTLLNFNANNIFLFKTVIKFINMIPLIINFIVFILLKASIKFKIHLGLGFNTNGLHFAFETVYLFLLYKI